VIAIPAIDLRAGACVQPRENTRHERAHDASALSVARELVGYGFRRLHLADLDAAGKQGRVPNREVLRNILFERSADVQVQGGLSDTERVREVLDSGARFAIVGNRGVEDPDWLGEIADLFEDEVILKVEIRERRVASPRRRYARSIDVFDLLEELRALPVAALLVIDMERRGQLTGPNLALMEELAEEFPSPVYAAGGIASIGQLRALEDRAVGGAIVGRALHSGALNPHVVATEFSA
jgi:phosphoribosylformimino-5-aminoimidazole carboxamide ribonucleotide (ProFAR) isomerase